MKRRIGNALATIIVMSFSIVGIIILAPVCWALDRVEREDTTAV